MARYPVGGSIAIVGYYYYLFQFKYPPFLTRTVKLHYQFYPEFNLVPYDKKGDEIVFESTYVKYLDYKTQGSIFFNCGDGKLRDNTEEIYRKGIIKVKLK
jgi:hypothetical protein